jgi:transcriptional regulator with XRE-family HTH domain
MIISKVIREHGYTIEQVAEKMGLKRGSLANIIGGNPTVDTLQKIADAIGCRRGDFFADESETPIADGEETVITINRNVKTIRIKLED